MNGHYGQISKKKRKNYAETDKNHGPIMTGVSYLIFLKRGDVKRPCNTLLNQ